MKLYYHKTVGGAEYLTDTFIRWSHNGKSGKEGTVTDKTKYMVRIDGYITKDAELSVREPEQKICANCNNVLETDGFDIRCKNCGEHQPT